MDGIVHYVESWVDVVEGDPYLDDLRIVREALEDAYNALRHQPPSVGRGAAGSRSLGSCAADQRHHRPERMDAAANPGAQANVRNAGINNPSPASRSSPRSRSHEGHRLAYRGSPVSPLDRRSACYHVDKEWPMNLNASPLIGYQEKPWDHPYDADSTNQCIHCGYIGSYAHTKEFYETYVWNDQPAYEDPWDDPAGA